ncbi:MAG TPA: hypothetical protein VL485_27440 [Ktedonobacteraceae bacterium]|jgi:hypothetical protein|nr:hypothetical protein [Ktedonobacteraceae bacterium]
MSIEQVKEIANAVLYEGYLLYPYRHSALKNRQRWTFGVLSPCTSCQTKTSQDTWIMRTECLIQGDAHTTVDVYVRFLHLLLRRVESAHGALPALPSGNGLQPYIGGQDRGPVETWEEGVEREVPALDLSLQDLIVHPQLVRIAFPGRHMTEPFSDTTASVIVREQYPISGIIKLSAEQLECDLYKLNVQIENATSESGREIERHDLIILQSFVSTHTILQVHQGTFISLMDPPETLQAQVQKCHNSHTWPVLAGKEGAHDIMLSSPIILYDYPQIAPESAGSLFDGTEIDEILTLRIMALSDEEKREIEQSGDERAHEILKRTESLSHEQLLKLHGTLRHLQPTITEKDRPREPQDDQIPISLYIANKQVRAGQRVRLQPSARADAFDILLKGKTGRVEAIQQDFENRFFLVVTLDDDPGREQWDERVLPGHRFFFYPEEVELLEDLP